MPSGTADKNVEGIDWIVENKKIETAIFAGGCFWCMTKPFDQMPGIISVRSGYTGGDVENPTYEQVKSGTTGHTEAVKIVFDKTIISYEELLEIYWHQTDPTDAKASSRTLLEKSDCKRAFQKADRNQNRISLSFL